MSYPGGKAGSGVYQTIINQMPPHDVYIEPFLGAGAVMFRKRSANKNIGLDLNPLLAMENTSTAIFSFRTGCGIEFLSTYQGWTGRELVYCDPPYVMSSRKRDREIYEHEMGDLRHAILLNIIKTLPCMVMISGYGNPLYDTQLAAWRRVEFQGVSRGGPTTEVLWCNFAEPTALHDYRYLGADYRQRERIARKVKRWRGKFDGLDPLERLAILSELTAT